ncbi:MAG: plasmid recombination protein [Lachnospiraceae bacterium]|nr:plasmid recombination protein [Lachnospiraceae bacterium]
MLEDNEEVIEIKDNVPLDGLEEGKYMSDFVCTKAELVIQLGDAELNDKSLEMKKQMLPIFEDQLKHLQELVQDFRIVSAVVHLDEHSPHAHVIGLPIGRGYKRGM